MAERIPTKSELLRAAAIVKTIANKGYSINRLFELYWRKREPKNRYLNIFKPQNINFDDRILSMWEKVLSKHKYRADMNKKGELTSRRGRSPVRRRAKRERLLRKAEEHRKRGLMQGTIDKICQAPLFQHHKSAKSRALLMDHLFISMEPDHRKRYLRLVNIFSGRHKIEDRLWVLMMWDLIRIKKHHRDSIKLKEKYIGNN